MLSTRNIGFVGAACLALLVETRLAAAEVPVVGTKCGTPQAVNPVAPPTSGRAPLPGNPQGVGVGRRPLGRRVDRRIEARS